MKNLLFLIPAILFFSSCKEKVGCTTPILPPVPATPWFRLVDKPNGEDIVNDLRSIEDSLTADQSCNDFRSEVRGLIRKEIPLFLVEGVQLDESITGGCKTIYVKLGKDDEDTLTIEGKTHTYNNNDPCGPRSEFIVEKVLYNGSVATKEKIEDGNGYGTEYYRLKK